MLKEAMTKERDAITQMIEETNGQYDEIVELLEKCQGKLVFMGVGKSGHIGKKLAATFASLGMPSFFVHSTEAMHGDLGMIESKDIAIGGADKNLDRKTVLRRKYVHRERKRESIGSIRQNQIHNRSDPTIRLSFQASDVYLDSKQKRAEE